MRSPRANPLPPGSQSITPKKRCAVYTRKSTDEGLDQEYNSLEASATQASPSSPANGTKAGSPSATATTMAATLAATWIVPPCAA